MCAHANNCRAHCLSKWRKAGFDRETFSGRNARGNPFRTATLIINAEGRGMYEYVKQKYYFDTFVPFLCVNPDYELNFIRIEARTVTPLLQPYYTESEL